MISAMFNTHDPCKEAFSCAVALKTLAETLQDAFLFIGEDDTF